MIDTRYINTQHTRRDQLAAGAEFATRYSRIWQVGKEKKRTVRGLTQV